MTEVAGLLGALAGTTMAFDGFLATAGALTVFAGCDENEPFKTSATDGGSAIAAAGGNVMVRHTAKMRAQRIRPP